MPFVYSSYTPIISSSISFFNNNFLQKVVFFYDFFFLKVILTIFLVFFYKKLKFTIDISKKEIIIEVETKNGGTCMGKESRMMEYETAPAIGGVVRIEHHLVGSDWAPVILHWHDYCELELITAGTGVHTLNNRTMRLSRGSAYICMLDDFHTLKNDDDNIMELINLKFPESIISPDILKKLYSVANRRYCQVEEPELHRILSFLSFFEEIQATNYANKELKRVLIESMLNQVLILFLLQIPEGTNETAVNKDEYRIQKAIAYIHKNFKQDISAYDMAKYLDLSVNYFSTLFKKKTGQNFSIYLSDLRLNYARNLIESKHMTKVSEIANMSGFYSTSYFIRAFKRKFKTTPKEMIIKESQ